MNRKIIFLLLLLFANHIVWACDLCSIYIGIQPNDFKSSFGIRYRYRVFEDKYSFNTSTNTINNTNELRLANGSPSSINHIEGEYFETEKNEFLYKEQYNSYDLILNIALGKRFNILINNSFSDNYVYKNDSIIDNISGVGDMQLLINYKLFYTKITSDSLAKNRLLYRLTLGLGVELPTGSFNKKTAKSYETIITGNTILGQPVMRLDPHLQPGTGSINYLFLIEYLLKYNNLGWNNNISYKINSVNKNEFQFANRFNVNTSIFYSLKINNNLIFMPNGGVSYEYSTLDTQNNIDVFDSGGAALFFTPGVKSLYKNVAFDINYYHPTYNYLYGNQPSNKARIIGQLTYNF